MEFLWRHSEVTAIQTATILLLDAAPRADALVRLLALAKRLLLRVCFVPNEHCVRE